MKIPRRLRRVKFEPAAHHTTSFAGLRFVFDLAHRLGVVQELRALTVKKRRRGIPIEDFWARARPVQIASVPTLVFGHEDLLLHLAMHLTAHAFVGRIRTLCDIGETCRRHDDAIDWSQLIARACAYDLAKPLYYSLRLARELVGADVPSQALVKAAVTRNGSPAKKR